MRRGVKIWVRDSYEMWKSLDSKSDIIFDVPLMCWEYIDALLIMRVKTNHLATFYCSSSLNRSNDTLYIHPTILELSMKARMCVPGTNFWMVR